ncbi:hypothetical protein Taro_027009 [Colocasia esculenta]|uniref:Uncharacterized protein n=1 Tax=Colocasia esculenta TaxID=4460 RepID=A0A843VEG9_COLES|nr:hypothetical protein [Colocasia esculenta]
MSFSFTGFLLTPLTGKGMVQTRVGCRQVKTICGQMEAIYRQLLVDLHYLGFGSRNPVDRQVLVVDRNMYSMVKKQLGELTESHVHVRSRKNKQEGRRSSHYSYCNGRNNSHSFYSYSISSSSINNDRDSSSNRSKSRVDYRHVKTICRQMEAICRQLLVDLHYLGSGSRNPVDRQVLVVDRKEAWVSRICSTFNYLSLSNKCGTFAMVEELNHVFINSRPAVKLWRWFMPLVSHKIHLHPHITARVILGYVVEVVASEIDLGLSWVAYFYGEGNSLTAETRALCDGLRIAVSLGIDLSAIYSGSLALVHSIKQRTCG